MSKSDKHLGQLVNRLRTAANALDKEAAAAKAAAAEFPGWENTPAGQAESLGAAMREVKASGLRAMARDIERWLRATNG